MNKAFSNFTWRDNGTPDLSAVNLNKINNGLNTVDDRVVQHETDIGNKYSKPSSGIPKSDLASAVRTSLEKADNSSVVSVSSSGTATSVANYITVNGTQYKLPTGGSGGTTNYADLTNKPQIEGHTLNGGNNTASTLGLATTAQVNEKSKVSVSNSGTSTNTVNYITVDDVQYKLPTGGGTGTSNYNDLSNKPKIGGVTLSGDQTASTLGLATATDVNGKYTKPTTGIPKNDLASAVQTSLGKADNALPSANISHETWTFTLSNGSTLTKEVVLWIS